MTLDEQLEAIELKITIKRQELQRALRDHKSSRVRWYMYRQLRTLVDKRDQLFESAISGLATEENKKTGGEK